MRGVAVFVAYVAMSCPHDTLYTLYSILYTLYSIQYNANECAKSVRVKCKRKKFLKQQNHGKLEKSVGDHLFE